MDQTFQAKMEMPDFVTPEEGVVECYLLSENEKGVEALLPIDVSELFSKEGPHTEQRVASVQKSLREKAFDKSNQSFNELGHTTISNITFEQAIQPLPYDPECFANFLEISEVHKSCVETKVDAALGRKYLIKPQFPVQKLAEDDDTSEDDFTITPEEYRNDFRKIQSFIKNCNQDIPFEDNLRLAGIDRQAIGWAAFEVVREASGKAARLYRVPATRLRVLEGFEGFVEVVGFDREKPIYQFYQRFGDKVVVDAPDPFDFTNQGKTVARPYNPEEDGELQIGERNIRWNLVSKLDGKPLKANGIDAFQEAASEILYLPNNHPNTVYYGYADVVPAISAILGNVYIRDYVHQFFEHNCVPRWAIIVKGAKVDGKFRELLEEYFQKNIRGKANQTLLLTLGGNLQNVHVEFQKLDVGHKEADFMQTVQMHNQQIMTSERVPGAMIGISDRATLGSRGLGAAEIFKDYVITPLQQYFARKLNLLFRLGLGVLNAKLEFMELDVRDSLTKAQILQILTNLGYYNINEGRDEYGMAAIKGGDVHYVRIRDGSALKVEDLIDLVYQNQLDTEYGNEIKPSENVENNILQSVLAKEVGL